MPNILDPDQAWCSVGSDLGPNCLNQSAEDDWICRWQAVPKHSIILCWKNMSAYYMACIYSSALQSRSYGSKWFEPWPEWSQRAVIDYLYRLPKYKSRWESRWQKSWLAGLIFKLFVHISMETCRTWWDRPSWRLNMMSHFIPGVMILANLDAL